MVSKLHLAVQEVCINAIADNEDTTIIDALLLHYDAIGDGIGVHKSPALYGAFPTDPYSHTPQHKGAQQPGMTGQVKEDILTRMGELGVKVSEGKISFDPKILKRKEFITTEKQVTFIATDENEQQLTIGKDNLAFTVCQVPVIYTIDNSNFITVEYKNGTTEVVKTHVLNAEISKKIFERSGDIAYLKVGLTEGNLR